MKQTVIKHQDEDWNFLGRRAGQSPSRLEKCSCLCEGMSPCDLQAVCCVQKHLGSIYSL